MPSFLDRPWRYANKELVSQRDQYRFRETTGADEDAKNYAAQDAAPTGADRAAQLDKRTGFFGGIQDIADFGGRLAQAKSQLPQQPQEGDGGFLGALGKVAKSPWDVASGVVTDVKDAATGGSFTDRLGDFTDAISPIRSVAGPLGKLDATAGRRISGPVLNQVLDEQGNVDTNPVEAVKNAGRAALKANPAVTAARALFTSIKDRTIANPYEGEEAFNRFQASDAPAGLKTAANFATPGAFLAPARVAVGGIAGAGAADQIAANQDAPDWLRQVAPIGGAVVGGIVAHDPAKAYQMLQKLPGVKQGFGSVIQEPENAKQIASDYLDAQKKAQPGRIAETAAQRAEQQAKGEAAYKEVFDATGDVDAAHAAARSAQAGKFGYSAEAVPIDTAHIPALKQGVNDALQKQEVSSHVAFRVLDDLKDIEANGPRVLTQREWDDWAAVFGKDKVERLMAGDGPAFLPNKPYPTMGLPGIGPETDIPPTPTVGGDPARLAGEAAAESVDTRGAAGWKPEPAADNPAAKPLAMGEQPLLTPEGAVATPQHGKMAGEVPYFRQGEPIRAPGVSDARPGATDLALGEQALTTPEGGIATPERGAIAAEPMTTEAIHGPTGRAAIPEALTPEQIAARDAATADMIASGAGVASRQRLIESELGYQPDQPNIVELGKVPAGAAAKAAKVAEPLTTRQRVWNTIADALNLPMGLITGPDISATGRQGLALGAGNPRQVWGAMKAQIAALRSPEGLAKAEDAIRSNPAYPVLKKSKLFLASDAPDVYRAEEVLASKWIDKIPLLRGSARAYVAYLDTLRANVFYKELDNMVKAAAKEGTSVSQQQIDDLAEVINHGSGRGTGTMLDAAGKVQVHPFFSIRNAASKPQLFADMFMRDGIARKQAIQQVVGMGLVVGGFDALTVATGLGGVGLNPLSGNFGKAQIGPHSVDLSGGTAGLIRTGAQFVTGQRAVSGGGYDVANRADTLGHFALGKLSPTYGFVTDLLRQKDFNDRPIDWKALTGDGSLGAELSHLGAPLLYGDIVNAVQAEYPNMDAKQALTAFALGTVGIAMANPSAIAAAAQESGGLARVGAVAGLSVLGGSVRSGLSPQQELRDAQEAAAKPFGKKWDDLPGSQKSVLLESPELAPLAKAAKEDSASRMSDSGKSSAASQKYAGQVQALSQELEDGTIDGNQFRDQLHTLQSELRGARDVLGTGGKSSDIVDGWFRLSDKAKTSSGRIDFDKLDQLQSEYEAAHPGVAAEVDKVTGVSDNATMREYRQAKALQQQYQQIPAYLGLDAKQSQKAGQLLAKARSMVSYGFAPDLEIAMIMAAGDDSEAFGNAYLANALGPNPERMAFRKDPNNRALAKFYSAVGGEAA